MNDYPANWNEIAQRVKDEANWKCIRCGHAHDTASGYCLTVHHMDGDKANCRWWNLVALCQRCHLHIQGKVTLRQHWPFEHSTWFKVYAAGWYAFVYQGRELTRAEAEAELPQLLALERLA